MARLRTGCTTDCLGSSGGPGTPIQASLQLSPRICVSLPQGKPFSPLASLHQCRHEAEEDEEHCGMQGSRSQHLTFSLTFCNVFMLICLTCCLYLRNHTCPPPVRFLVPRYFLSDHCRQLCPATLQNARKKAVALSILPCNSALFPWLDACYGCAPEPFERNTNSALVEFAVGLWQPLYAACLHMHLASGRKSA